MTALSLANALIAQGHSVTTYTRPDGGIRIVSIDGMRFPKSSAEGNNQARSMLGQGQLSASQKAQRATAGALSFEMHKATPSMPRLTKPQKKKLAKLNRMAAKVGADKTSRKQARQNIGRHQGKTSDLWQSIGHKIQHHQDVSYMGDVTWFLGELQGKDVMPKTREFLAKALGIADDPEEIDNSKYKYNISDTALKAAHEWYYKIGKDGVTEAQADEEALAILKAGTKRIAAANKQFFKSMKL